MRIYLIKTPPGTTIGDQIQFALDNAGLLKKYKEKIAGITHNDVEMLELIGLIVTDKSLSDGRDMSATKRFHDNILKYNGFYYENALFIEEKINSDGDTEIAIKLGLRFQKPHGQKNKAPIKGKNTSTKGVLEIELTRIKMGIEKPKFAHHYDVFGGLVTDEGTGIAVKFGTLGKVKGLVKGFTSGGKYSVYAIPIDSDGNEGEPTPAFIIRVN